MRQYALIYSMMVLSLLSIASNVRGQNILYDSNGFEAPTFTAGSSPVGQDASNPWQAAGGSPTAFVVENSMVASGSQAVQANGGGLNDGSFVFPGIFDQPGPNERVDIQVDMARTLSPNVDDSSPVYAIDIYDDGVNRTSRFGLQYDQGSIRAFVSVPVNSSGQVDPNGTGIQSEFLGPAVSSDTFVHFNFTLDYTTKTVDLSMNGVLLAAGVPFVTQSSVDIVAAALQIGTFQNSADNGYFDNYVVSVVPYLHGDANNDGIVNSQDLALVSSNWSQTGLGLTGDVNEDGIVNAQDLALISSNWQQSLNSPAAPAAATVPEPGTLVLAAGGALCSLIFWMNRPRRDTR